MLALGQLLVQAPEHLQASGEGLSQKCLLKNLLLHCLN